MPNKDAKARAKNNKTGQSSLTQSPSQEETPAPLAQIENTQNAATAYLAQMQAERGYILEWHKVLAEHDFEFLKGYNALLEAAYTKPRTLDVKTKEMVITAVLMAVRSQPAHIKTHLEMCKQFGATAQEMLEVLEVVLPPAGVPAFMHSFDVWREVYGIE